MMDRITRHQYGEQNCIVSTDSGEAYIEPKDIVCIRYHKREACVAVHLQTSVVWVNDVTFDYVRFKLQKMSVGEAMSYANKLHAAVALWPARTEGDR